MLTGAFLKNRNAFSVCVKRGYSRNEMSELTDYVKVYLLSILEAKSMKRMPFEPPINHYDERIEAIDEQICQLIKQRKELSNNNPGFPTKQHIADWSKEYNFYEEFLNSIFSDFLYKRVLNYIINKPLILIQLKQFTLIRGLLNELPESGHLMDKWYQSKSLL